jgi:hypothetical protein
MSKNLFIELTIEEQRTIIGGTVIAPTSIPTSILASVPTSVINLKSLVPPWVQQQFPSILTLLNTPFQ